MLMSFGTVRTNGNTCHWFVFKRKQLAMRIGRSGKGDGGKEEPTSTKGPAGIGKIEGKAEQRAAVSV
jgi:hypothetical protein